MLSREELGDNPVPFEEDGRRWWSRTDILESCLWERLETEEADPGLWRERREEDRPSPIKRRQWHKKESRRRR